MARPTDYSEEILEEAQWYLDNTSDTREPYLKVNLPSVAGLARHLNVARSTIYEWAEIHEAFSDILEDILAEQEKRLAENGLAGDYNSTITKLMLTKHGY